MKIEVLSKKNFEGFAIQIFQAEESKNTLWLSGEEVGEALHLEDPKMAVHQIYQRHKDELEEFSMLWTIETSGGPQEVRIFSEEGVYMITTRRIVKNDLKKVRALLYAG
jgi:prophage antirepressor-like protein